MSISFLEQGVQHVQGIKGRRVDVLADAGVRTVRDLLHYYPRRYLDRSSIVPIRALRGDMSSVTVVGEVVLADTVKGRSGQRFELIVQDDAGQIMKCVWFKGAQWIRGRFSKGDRVAFHGKPQRYGGMFSMAHPDFDKLDVEGEALETGRIIALYPGGVALAGVGLNSRTFRRILHDFFKEHEGALPESLPSDICEAAQLMDGPAALHAIHFPEDRAELEAAQRRLKFEELFSVQIMLAQLRRRRIVHAGPRFEAPGAHMRQFLQDGLPFELTGAQRSALKDIARDMRSGKQMRRLLQGDVGSGKTVVAVAAMLHALDSGYQSAFMAPTEILAEQHYANLRKYLDPLDVRIRLLVGGLPKAERGQILADIAEGQASIAVGTHALIQEDVAFHRLGLAIVDEQHRFGVMQRARMFEMGTRPHMLLMTATPIPRSLAMTLYGDLDVSIMNELPPGRRPVRTALRYDKSREQVYDFVRGEIEKGRQCYIVYPLVEESEKMDLKDAESGHEELKKIFAPYKVGLIHGRMSRGAKEDTMTLFHRDDLKVLVATTVIEVGVDVSNATIMIVEHAERFGLSQLHQLRGRVGRGGEQSYCILMADYKCTHEARERLQVMVDTNDGFRISEADLKIRGAGDFFGTRQSGLPELKIAELPGDVELLTQARDMAFELVTRDPDLMESGHAALREHLHAVYGDRGMGLSRVG